ncbi:sulfurtransferase DndC [Anoxybacter fermentans]|uniref:Sulfurtransferase DndC n=1 Tax=Anoxybacter fermentans TaxID=1323375 RepID=A0A3Q9HP62_9FIRM|nr:DNA phosphorothioation system sulfurtransferase DndC [Anoxybacter fermentans]AZR72511.1 sulfurtransferase DndC [Anoxybacter fermentans]
MKFDEKVASVMAEIKRLYKADARPWVIGYSGGKDSTTVVQLVFNAINELPENERHKQIYVITSDTLVEIPIIKDYLESNLKKIQKAAEDLKLPIVVHKVKPEIDKTFWVNLIGKGYPSPRQKFRWCTDKLKIDPTNQFIRSKVEENGEVIMVLGVRLNESASRDQVLNSHRVEGKKLRTHSSLVNAYIYAPIEQFSTDDVWEYLLKYESPWGSDNTELLALYQDSAGECPLVIDRDTPSCGNSRFGCWVCTVVKEDKALKGFIENGERWLIPLLKFRNWIVEIRDDPKRRMNRSRNGRVFYLPDGRRSPGPFTLEARKEILRELLRTQKQIESLTGKQYQLILEKELIKIREIWLKDGDWEDSLPKIYREETGKLLIKDLIDQPIFTDQEMNVLSDLCKEEDVPFDLVMKLVLLETEYYGYKYRVGILDEINKILHEDWLHIQEQTSEESEPLKKQLPEMISLFDIAG